MRYAVGTPSARQREFMTATTRYVAYGGARGGGKSWAVRKKAALLALNYAGIRILIIRRTFPELRENHILPMTADLKGIARYRDSDHSLTFTNGSRVVFGYLQTDADVTQYQGQEYDIIFIDEATQFSEYQFSVLTACVRGANALPKRMYLTCNPGGVGHGWVKRLFIDRDYRGSEKPEDYTFIKALVFDNAALMENDPEYLQSLQNLPDGLREAWLNGDWDALSGRYFTSFNRETHTVEPFRIPADWERYFVLDYGLDMLAGYWIAVDWEGFAVVYREVYKSGLIISDAAAEIRRLTPGDEVIRDWIAPPDLWNRNRDTGRSAAEIFSEGGVLLRKASNDRVQGLYDMQEWMAMSQDSQGVKRPHLQVFTTCKNLIRCIPLAMHDEKDPNDMANEPHEITHSIDAIRYWCAGRPVAPVPVKVKDYDDPDIDDQIESMFSI